VGSADKVKKKERRGQGRMKVRDSPGKGSKT
jgi:hypothetical protein